MRWVVDASVAAKWFFPEEAADRARGLLAAAEVLVAPDLLLLEVANVAWKRVTRGEIPAEQARAVTSALPRLFSLLVPATELLGQTLEFALATEHSVYDCAYLALARTRGLPLVTADRRLLADAGRLPDPPSVVLLEHWAGEG